MEKEFIPYEQALALKELGFNEYCLGNYRLPTNRLITEWEIRNTPESCLGISAPTFSQAFRWFRDKHSLFTQDFIDLDNKFTKNIVKVLKNGQDFFYLDYYKTYEEAELECLKKLIEIVKSK
ncbi:MULTISPECIES: hypothetical protein [Flavobacterium]|uniref:Uncharacterized protein n=1 Tax=Flavobacterium keumense TaxID=1306518 RepID=A0ABY8N2F5_9FLAO|nr:MULTISPECIES: hypothetical protein [Flavobacterium]WGK93830.1 hypothetical protein MG292_06925 [Flavobacterium keumense]